MVVDAVLEDIRLCMETSLSQLNQRRVAMVKCLGELYNYQLVEANVIFRMLYAFISFGNNPDGGWEADLIVGGNLDEGWGPGTNVGGERTKCQLGTRWLVGVSDG